VVLALDGVTILAGADDGVFDLRGGVVPGAGIMLPGRLGDEAAPATARSPISTPGKRRVPAPAPPKPAPAPAPTPQPEHEPPQVVDAGAQPAPPKRFDTIIGVDAGEPPRAPLEPGVAPGQPAPASGSSPLGRPAPLPDEPQARGYLCSRGHLNDPRALFCVLCGIRMNERTGELVLGRRPPLGLVVFDDGATYTLDADYLVGRMPTADGRVRSGGLRSIMVEDRTGSVSRVHAEVRLHGWDVVLVDSGSRNGTYVAPPGAQAWTPVPTRQSRRLVPGTRVRLGIRMFVFESPSGAR
jgi:hypothetical protein